MVQNVIVVPVVDHEISTRFNHFPEILDGVNVGLAILLNVGEMRERISEAHHCIETWNATLPSDQESQARGIFELNHS